MDCLVREARLAVRIEKGPGISMTAVSNGGEAGLSATGRSFMSFIVDSNTAHGRHWRDSFIGGSRQDINPGIRPHTGTGEYCSNAC
jgi:hypothetical protein